MKSPYKLYRQLRMFNVGLSIVHKLVLIGLALAGVKTWKHFTG
jgi:hypothetical protein